MNKIENAHKFAKAIAFGNNQEFSSGEKEEQDIIAACRQLIENSVVCWNYLYLTQKLNDANQKESQELLTAVKEGVSPNNRILLANSKKYAILIKKSKHFARFVN